MHKKGGLLCLPTCAAGAFGMFLRWLHLSSSFEAETGLAIPGSTSGLVLTVLCVAVTAALIVLVRTLKSADFNIRPRTAPLGRNILYPLLSGLLGLAIIVGSVIFFITAGTETYPTLMRILAVFSLACGVSFPVIAIGPKRDGSGALSCLASLTPVLFFCFWLIVSYKQNSANPVIWAYSIEILAIASALLGFYYIAGYAFGKIKPLLTIYFCQLGAFFCIVTLVDDRPFPLQMILFASAVMLLQVSVVIMGRTDQKEKDWING